MTPRSPRLRPIAAAAMALALVVTALGGCVIRKPNLPPPAIPKASTMGQTAGFDPGGNFTGLSIKDLTRELDGMKAAGATWIRLNFVWASMEPSSGKYSFAHMDQIVSLARARGLRPLALVAYTPKWARPAGCTSSMQCAPSNKALYARFMGKVVAHFSPRGVKYYEVWNEPNMYVFWKPKPSVSGYTDMLKRAYASAKAADRSVTVMAGSFAPAPDSRDGANISGPTFLSSMYRYGAKGSFDALSIHPYGGEWAPDTPGSWNMTLGIAPRLRATMVAKGDASKKIWGTEAGYSTAGAKAVTMKEQGTWLGQQFRLWHSLGYTGPLFVYNYRDIGTNRSDSFQNFGLVYRNWTPKPGLLLFASAMKQKL